MKTVKIKDKEFELFLTQEVIEKAIDDIAEKLNKDLAGKDPLFICVLNGSFMYASELMKRVTVPSEVSFVKMSSYQGTSSDVYKRQGTAIPFCLPGVHFGID